MRGSVEGHDLLSHLHTVATATSDTYGTNANLILHNQGIPEAQFAPSVTRRNTTATGGNETRPVNATVNWIIKY